jgi:hypothetical protein
MSRSKLYNYFNAASSKEEKVLGKHLFVIEIKKRKQLEIPPKELRAGDKVRYAKEEVRAAKRADYDIDYEQLLTKSLSD